MIKRNLQERITMTIKVTKFVVAELKLFLLHLVFFLSQVSPWHSEPVFPLDTETGYL